MFISFLVCSMLSRGSTLLGQIRRMLVLHDGPSSRSRILFCPLVVLNVSADLLLARLMRVGASLPRLWISLDSPEGRKDPSIRYCAPHGHRAYNHGSCSLSQSMFLPLGSGSHSFSVLTSVACFQW